LAIGRARPLQLGPAQGHVGHRAVSQQRTGRPRIAVRELPATADHLQLLYYGERSVTGSAIAEEA
jgi:hypothetical protein